jgi:hypothetical protein
MVTVHVIELPVHAPVQPANQLPTLGAAVSVTCVPATSDALQLPVWGPVVAPHEMPAGDVVTEPLPMPLVVTLSAKIGGGANAAVTPADNDIVSVHALARPY